MNTLADIKQAQAPQAISAIDAIMNIDVMNQINNLAQLMASGHATVPQHLQGNVGDCFAVILQSMQWGMNPFAVAQKTHFVNKVLGYEAQLVNAVITTRAPTTERLKFEWFGDWSKINGKEDKSSDKGVKVWATLQGEDEPRVLELTMEQVGVVRNSPLWTSDPRQQLAYLAIKRWARLYCPDVILGVYTPDEFDQSPEKDITPNVEQPPKVNSGSAALKARMAKNSAVESTAKEIDLTRYYNSINNATTLDELDQIGSDIAELNLGEPAKTEIRNVFRAKRQEIEAAQSFPDESVQAVIVEIENSGDLDVLNTIMGTRFEPFMSQMTEQQVDQINKAYEAQEAALTA